MIAPERFVITFTGTHKDYIAREYVQKGAAYVIDRLLSGKSVADDPLHGWGIKVTVEEDCDQGDD